MNCRKQKAEVKVVEKRVPDLLQKLVKVQLNRPLADILNAFGQVHPVVIFTRNISQQRM